MKPWATSDQQNQDQLLEGRGSLEITGKRDKRNSSVGSSQHGAAGKRNNTCNSSRDNRNKSLLFVRHEEETHCRAKRGWIVAVWSHDSHRAAH